MATKTKTAANKISAAKKTTKSTAKKASAKVTSAKKDVKAAVKKLDSAQDKIVDATENMISVRLSSAQKLAKQVWFAGLGAVGRSVEEVASRYSKAGEELQTRYTKLNKERVELVEDLVARGEKVQDGAQSALEEGRATVEEQIEAAKERLLGLTSVVNVPARLQDLSDKLESLSKDLKKSA